MNMNWLIQRGPSSLHSTTGEIFIDGVYECFSLEPPVREVPGMPVEKWKIPGRGVTAIPSTAFAGKPYEVAFVNSPRFGPDTLRIFDVPGFTGVNIHGGNSSRDSSGCIIVGDVLDWNIDEVSGAQRHGVLAKLKDQARPVLARGDKVLLTITNP